MSENEPDLFREEALEYHRTAHQRPGDVLRLSPGWTRWSYWLVLLALTGGLTYAITGSVSEYAEGPAVILFHGQISVTALRTGVVTRIAIPFDRSVTEGQALVKVQSREAPAGYDELAAPINGQVGEIYVHVGQRVSPGDVVFSVFPTDPESQKPGESGGSEEPKERERQVPREVVGILPGHYAPQLRRGMSLRLELTGYRYTYEELQIARVGEQVLGPSAVRRYFGQELADALPLSGPVVRVHAKLPVKAFTSNGESYAYRHGMHGTVRVRIRTERIIFTLAPWLKALFGD